MNFPLPDTPSIILILIIPIISGTVFSQPLQQLPEGNTGIASHYPNDAAISGDSAVIFADDFENYTSADQLNSKWNGGVYHFVSIAKESEHVYSGKQAVEFRSPVQTEELSNTIGRELGKAQECEVLFLRYYAKFDRTFNVVGSSHNGGGISAHYFNNGNATPGVPADGKNKFLIEYEFWRGADSEPSPGNLNIYIYHPGQRSQWGDHWFPDGTVMPNTYLPGDFGGDFAPRPNMNGDLGIWHCYEVMLKANTVSLHDGRVACWLDGKLVADFTNLRLRDVDSLKISRFNLSLHCGSNPSSETFKWYDNVVAAKSYIGPVYTQVSTKPLPAPMFNSPVGNHLITVGNTICFTAVKKSPVSLSIFSPEGTLVKQLFHETVRAGTISITWDGRDRSGNSVTSGFYLIRLRIQGETITRCMVLGRK